VITGIHALIFNHDADAVRAFVRDVLGCASVDAGGSWLILPYQPRHPTALQLDQG
jgi:hypothetical protein